MKNDEELKQDLFCWKLCERIAFVESWKQDWKIYLSETVIYTYTEIKFRVSKIRFEANKQRENVKV